MKGNPALDPAGGEPGDGAFSWRASLWTDGSVREIADLRALHKPHGDPEAGGLEWCVPQPPLVRLGAGMRGWPHCHCHPSKLL